MRPERRYRIAGILKFDSAFHIGSGRAGDLVSDMGVLKDPLGRPILPGSTLKGKFRSTIERLAGCVALTACMLDSELSDVCCATDEAGFQRLKGKKARDAFRDSGPSFADKETWVSQNVCDVCRLFGSPIKAGRIFFADAVLVSWNGVTETRDGVVIHRDSETATKNLKYDFEAISSETAYRISIDVENPTEDDLRLVGIGLSEWEQGVRLGGFTSRGLGLARLTSVAVAVVDFSNPSQVKQYLLNRKFTPQDGLGDFERALAASLG